MSHSASDWLSSLGLSALLRMFEDQEIDLDAARDLSEQGLRALGIAMGPRKKLLRAIAALCAPETPETPKTPTRRQTAARQAQVRSP